MQETLSEGWIEQGIRLYTHGAQTKDERCFTSALRCFKAAAHLEPQSMRNWMWTGRALMQLNSFVDAKEKLQRALSLIDSAKSEELFALYWDYGKVWTAISLQSGEAVDCRTALFSFHAAEKQAVVADAAFFEDFASAYLQMGRLINQPRFFALAAEQAQKAMNLNERAGSSWKLLGEIYTQLYLHTTLSQHLHAADQCYQCASLFLPEEASLWLDWARLLGEAGQHLQDHKWLERAIEKCRAAHRLGADQNAVVSQWIESLATLGIRLNRFDLLSEAEAKIAVALEQDPESTDLWYAYGTVLCALGEYFDDVDYYDIAMEKFQYGLSIDRTEAKLWHGLGLATSVIGKMLLDDQMLQRAVKFLGKAIDLQPGRPSLQIAHAKMLIALGEVNRDSKTIEMALQSFETVFSSQKELPMQHPQWIFSYAHGLLLMGELSHDEIFYSRSLEIFLQIALIDPVFPAIHQRLAITCSHLGDLRDSDELLKRALYHFQLSSKADPENEEIFLEWGICLICLGKLEPHHPEIYFLEAEEKLLAAGQLGCLQSYYNLACVCAFMHRIDEALAFLEKARLQRALPPLEEILDDEWLDNLQGTPGFSQFLALCATPPRMREE